MEFIGYRQPGRMSRNSLEGINPPREKAGGRHLLVEDAIASANRADATERRDDRGLQGQDRLGGVLLAHNINVVATLVARPRQEANLHAALSALVPVVRGEPGCIRYDLHRDLDAPERFVMIETWRDASALETHAQGEAFTALAARFDTLLSTSPDIRRLANLA